MKFSLFLVFLLTSTTVYAQNENFCLRDRASLSLALTQPENRLGFKNEGGLFNGGVCWWHSRLQRSSLYLAQFRPELPAPDKNQVQQILSSLKLMNKVVIIPGFENFRSFSLAYQPQIQKMLEKWQKEDGLINFQWMRGISGHYRLPAKDLAVRMNNLLDMVESSPTPLWVMAQIKGLTSHSFLIRQMEFTGNGYDLEVIDSNRPLALRRIRYQYGDEALRIEGTTQEFILYSGFQEDFKLIAKSLEQHCQEDKGLHRSHLFDGPIPRGEIEVRP